MKDARPHKLLASLIVTAMVTLGLGGASMPAALASVPGTPGVAQTGTTVYGESFSNEDATAGAISILRYQGGPEAADVTYTADTPYTPAGGECDGWILNSSTPLPTSDSGCLMNQPAGWEQVRQMAVALGLAQGQSPPQAAGNQVLSEYTNSAFGSIAAGVQFRTERNAAPAIAGHYYAVSAYFAQVNCHAAHASQTFSLLVNGTRQVLSAGLDPCGSSNQASVHVTKLQSAPYQVPVGTTNPTLGLELRNETTTGAGNDVAFDLPQIVDVTPQLDTAFVPALVNPGGTTRMTLTVTNTDELTAKDDWFLTDTLPAGIVVAGTPNLGGTCEQAPGTNPFVRTAVGGSNSISVTGGDIAPGMTACTITVDVTAAAEGTYVNGPATMVTNLAPPADAALTVRAPRLTLSTALNAARLLNEDQFTTEIRTGSADGPVVSSSANSTTRGSGATIAAGTGTTGEYVATAGATYYLTQSGSNLSGYDKSITCTDARGLQPGLPNGAAFAGSLAIVPVAGADVSCVLTNTATSAPGMEFAFSADASGVRSPAVVGDRIRYSFTSKNTGNVPLADVAIDAPKSGLSAVSYAWPGTPGVLLPGQRLIATATYAITQADIDAGHVANRASSTGHPFAGLPVAPPPRDADIPLVMAPAMQFTGSSRKLDADGLSKVGDIIRYNFASTNSGNVTLKDARIEAPLAGLSALSYTWPGTPGVLLPGQTVTAAASYAITQVDVDAGHVLSGATATGTPPLGPSVTPPPSKTDTPLNAASGLEFTMTAGASALGDPTQVGEVIVYKFTLHNTGNVPLTAVAVNHQTPGLPGPDYAWPGAEGTLLPGETVTATASYAVTQADADAGMFTSAATATGTPPLGPPVTTPLARVLVTFPQDDTDAIGPPTAETAPAGGNGATGMAPVAGMPGAGATSEPETSPSGSAVSPHASDVRGLSEGFLASTGVVLTVLPISLLVVGLGLFMFVAGRRRGSRSV
ncbi:hypothetical protein [Arthrobacter sp. ISL-95]|uniref:DUF7507 domain-containing protein n=1 Tax=Arthrobacter sp. ISL-95 TaxID=2819116 RepID=UPI001BE4FF0A|nr:hypothetical protein [Arthrobacter sp. ISL-95]MBT2585218.1 hypothetical protein [Arthrobacter sp. ISL-95]